MTNRSSQPRVTTALADEPNAMSFMTCPMCHTPTAITQGAIDAGADWPCERCGQHWNASRLSAVADYEVWVSDRALRGDASRAESRRSC